MSAGRPLVFKLQQMVGGMRGKEGLRRHAFIQTCQALTRAADAAEAAAEMAEAVAADAETATEANSLTGAAAEEAAADAAGITSETAAAAGSGCGDGAIQEHQLALLQAMQLLQVCITVRTLGFLPEPLFQEGGGSL